MVPEAKLEQTDAGLVPASAGWFVLNARDGGVAYARFPQSQKTRYAGGLLPGD